MNKIYLRPFYTFGCQLKLFAGRFHCRRPFAHITNNNSTLATKCVPTEKLQKMVDKDPLMAEMVRRIQKEFEIYEYFAALVPTVFKDRHWHYLLKTTSVNERVRYFWFMGLNEGKDIKDQEKRTNLFNELNAKYKEQAELIKAGGMGYGAGLYRHLKNPLANPLRENTPFTLWNAIQLGMNDPPPQLLFDCQFFQKQDPHEYSRVSGNGAHAFYENYDRRSPFSSSFININSDDPRTRNFINKYIVPLKRTEWHRQLRISPSFHRNNPYHDSHDGDPRKQVIYISKYADELLDGPLIHKAYVLPLTFDRNRETVGAARRGNYRTMYLPIRKYIKWASGGFNVTFVTFVNIMHEVANNGGDWKYALTKFIPIRNLLTTDERKERMGRKQEKLNEQLEEKKRITETIIEALGHQPGHFSNKSEEKAAILEYSNNIKIF